MLSPFHKILLWQWFCKKERFDTCYCFCLQATFCGSSLGNMRGYHFSQKDFEKMGHHFLDTLLDYCDPNVSKVMYE